VYGQLHAPESFFVTLLLAMALLAFIWVPIWVICLLRWRWRKGQRRGLLLWASVLWPVATLLLIAVGGSFTYVDNNVVRHKPVALVVLAGLWGLGFRLAVLGQRGMKKLRVQRRHAKNAQREAARRGRSRLDVAREELAGSTR